MAAVIYLGAKSVPVVKYIQESGWKFMSEEDIARFTAAEEAGHFPIPGVARFETVESVPEHLEIVVPPLGPSEISQVTLDSASLREEISQAEMSREISEDPLEGMDTEETLNDSLCSEKESVKEEPTTSPSSQLSTPRRGGAVLARIVDNLHAANALSPYQCNVNVGYPVSSPLQNSSPSGLRGIVTAVKLKPSFGKKVATSKPDSLEVSSNRSPDEATGDSVNVQSLASNSNLNSNYCKNTSNSSRNKAARAKTAVAKSKLPAKGNVAFFDSEAPVNRNTEATSTATTSSAKASPTGTKFARMCTGGTNIPKTGVTGRSTVGMSTGGPNSDSKIITSVNTESCIDSTIASPDIDSTSIGSTTASPNVDNTSIGSTTANPNSIISASTAGMRTSGAGTAGTCKGKGKGKAKGTVGMSTGGANSDSKIITSVNTESSIGSSPNIDSTSIGSTTASPNSIISASTAGMRTSGTGTAGTCKGKGKGKPKGKGKAKKVLSIEEEEEIALAKVEKEILKEEAKKKREQREKEKLERKALKERLAMERTMDNSYRFYFVSLKITFDVDFNAARFGTLEVDINGHLEKVRRLRMNWLMCEEPEETHLEGTLVSSLNVLASHPNNNHGVMRMSVPVVQVSPSPSVQGHGASEGAPQQAAGSSNEDPGVEEINCNSPPGVLPDLEEVSRKKAVKRFHPPTQTNGDLAAPKPKKKKAVSSEGHGFPVKKGRKQMMGAQQRSISANSSALVQCLLCEKWRKLYDCKDPSQYIEQDWYCHMNSDTEHNRCDAPEEDYSQLKDNEEFVETAFVPGIIVWAKMVGYPWWPAMIEEDPDLNVFYLLDGDTSVPDMYHVVFFDTPVNRTWVRATQIQLYSAMTNPNRGPHASLAKKHRKSLQKSRAQATEALGKSLVERLEQCSFCKRYLDGKKPIFDDGPSTSAASDLIHNAIAKIVASSDSLSGGPVQDNVPEGKSGQINQMETNQMETPQISEE